MMLLIMNEKCIPSEVNEAQGCKNDWQECKNKVKLSILKMTGLSVSTEFEVYHTRTFYSWPIFLGNLKIHW